MRTKFGKKCLEVFIFFDPHMWRLCCLETLDMWLAQALYNHLLMGPDSKLSYASKQRYLNPIPAAPGITKLSPIPRTVLFNFSFWNETGVSYMVGLLGRLVIYWRIPILDPILLKFVKLNFSSSFDAKLNFELFWRETYWLLEVLWRTFKSLQLQCFNKRSLLHSSI